MALVAAGVAAGLALLFPPAVVATTSVQVGAVGTPDPGPATASALAAASTAAFTDRVSALSGATPAEIDARVSVSSPAPGVVDIRVAGTDAAAATAVAKDAVTALGARVSALDTAVTAAGTDPLRAELDRKAALGDSTNGGDGSGLGTGTTPPPDPFAEQLGRTLAERTGLATVVVPGPEPVVAPEVPTAVWVLGAAVLAGLAVPVLVAVGVPAVRRGRGLLPEADPAGALRDELDVPVLAPGHAPGAVPVLADAYRTSLRGLEAVTVVQLTAEPACDIAGELVKAAALVGDRREYVDLTPGAEPVPPEAGVPVIRALRTPRLAHEDLGELRDSGPTVLAVQTAGTRPGDVASVAAALRAVGAPPVLCLVWTGRLPDDPARVPLPTDARIRAVMP
ncbi:hypothetical protein [Pseudonocardia parietis]|uniref:Capsular polysaccharide biosynthesis protein n=1 Tax=Pseudonocardia parietis TaxID=570936 RepID=A0ABS4VY82_9PSEU|nr:hypothetical protein [Pseudonocardia parietis]MBP2368908.1 hypothetical protein [Pseudonocardia parietis]